MNLGNYKNKDILFIDIETVGREKTLKKTSNAYDAFSYKMRNDDSDKSMGDLYLEKSPLIAEYGQIVCISVGRVTSDNKLSIKSYVGDEGALLNEFASDLNKFSNPVFCGHSIKGFDLPFIAKRMTINGVELHNQIDNGLKKPWEVQCLDIADLWKNAGWSNATLSCMCYAMGIETSKGDMSGKDVHKTFWGTEKDRVKKIQDYCEKDVMATAELYFKMSQKGTIKVAKKPKKNAVIKYKEPKHRPTDNVIIKESICEPGVIVEFNETTHTYHWGDEILTGGTTSIEKFIKKFDADVVAPRCAKAWGVKEQEVKDIWSTRGDSASIFGTSIHVASETYDTWEALSDKIDKASKSGAKEYKYPSHPLLRNIIEELNKVMKPLDKKYKVKEVIPEALVSLASKGRAGLIDRMVIINKKNKICRIQDFKINVDVQEISSKYTYLGEFKHLPKNKLSKYSLQLSDYAELLRLAGWTVQGLDVFVLDKEWKHYEVELLDFKGKI